MRILLVSPDFHGYWRAFAAALDRLGHETVSFRYDTGTAFVRFGNAVTHRLQRGRLVEAMRDRATNAAIHALQTVKPDAVLVVKGDALGADWWDAVSRSGARAIVWLYDELDRMNYNEESLDTVRTVFTYSPQDAQTLANRGISASHLPLGFDSLVPYQPTAVSAVTFVGARYPGREATLRALHRAGEPVRAYGREWSRNPWDIIRTRRWQSAGVPSGRDLARAAGYGIMAGSVGTLNIHGHAQDGFTMRTFEAPGVGALHLVDRPDVQQHYDVGTEALVFTSDDELLDHIRRAHREPAWAQRIREAGQRRTLAQHTLVHRMKEVEQRWA